MDVVEEVPKIYAGSLPRMVKSGHSVQFALLPEAIKSVRRMCSVES